MRPIIMSLDTSDQKLFVICRFAYLWSQKKENHALTQQPIPDSQDSEFPFVHT